MTTRDATNCRTALYERTETGEREQDEPHPLTPAHRAGGPEATKGDRAQTEPTDRACGTLARVSPTVGRIVHFVYADDLHQRTRAALVSAVFDVSITLHVFVDNPHAPIDVVSVPRDPHAQAIGTGAAGRWFWPERVPVSRAKRVRKARAQKRKRRIVIDLGAHAADVQDRP